MAIAKIVVLSLATIAVVAAIAALLMSKNDAENKRNDSSDDTGKDNNRLDLPPPEPVFSDNDGDQCRDAITRYYDIVSRSFNQASDDQAKVNDAYERILDLQETTGVQLVNNEDFLDFCLSDWETRWSAYLDPDAPKPEYTDEVIQVFNPEALGMPQAEELDSVEELDEALVVMFRFRQYWSIEDGIMLIQGWEDYQLQDDCSKRTNELVDVYSGYNYAYVGPSTYVKWMEMGNFLTRTAEWLESQ